MKFEPIVSHFNQKSSVQLSDEHNDIRLTYLSYLIFQPFLKMAGTGPQKRSPASSALPVFLRSSREVLWKQNDNCTSILWVSCSFKIILELKLCLHLINFTQLFQLPHAWSLTRRQGSDLRPLTFLWKRCNIC